MAVGRLTSDNEVLALGALGVPSRQILVPLLVLGLAFSFVSFVMNDYFMPLGNIRFAEIYRRVLYTNPAVELEPRSVKKYEETTIVTGDIEGTVIRDILIIDRSPEKNRRITGLQRVVESLLARTAPEGRPMEWRSPALPWMPPIATLLPEACCRPGSTEPRGAKSAPAA